MSREITIESDNSGMTEILSICIDGEKTHVQYSKEMLIMLIGVHGDKNTIASLQQVILQSMSEYDITEEEGEVVKELVAQTSRYMNSIYSHEVD